MIGFELVRLALASELESSPNHSARLWRYTYLTHTLSYHVLVDYPVRFDLCVGPIIATVIKFSSIGVEP